MKQAGKNVLRLLAVYSVEKLKEMDDFKVGCEA